MGWNKDSSTGKARAMCASKTKQRIHSPVLMGGQVFSTPHENNQMWEVWDDKHHHSKCSIHTSFFPRFVYQPWLHMVWNIPWVSQGLLWPFPTPCAPPEFLLVGWGEEKRSWLCVSFAQQKWKHPCIINTISSTNPNHSPESAAVKKIDSIPAKSVQCCKYIFDVQKTRFDYFAVP